jgi:SAM-dependent methyltransferase
MAPSTHPVRNGIREAVREAYSAASKKPQGEHAFPVGRTFAECLGYPKDLLERLPAVSVEAFSGVSNVSVSAEISSGARVLDLGCGAGVDSLIAALRTGPQGTVVGVDFSAEMLERARKAAFETSLDNVLFCQADAEALPIKTESIDVALINGIFNLNPSRTAIFRELARVLRVGGAAYAAELILREPLPPAVRSSEANWFA